MGFELGAEGEEGDCWRGGGGGGCCCCCGLEKSREEEEDEEVLGSVCEDEDEVEELDEAGTQCINRRLPNGWQNGSCN